MDVRIGITETNQVIEIEMGEDADREATKKQLDDVLGDGKKVLWLTDRKGKEYVVPSSSISYVELSEVDPERRIGFGA